ncbi:DEAD/DEAH box helicase family protein [Treponema bryantii]|uniref:DEAD/DEAH box helicase family protein n=1 Tax=Treponema bryantii TaxID=163 RepID=UPI0003B37F4C|nr:DEAD/DEAH box helicase family protein [Treponema bryantii]
MNFDYLKGNTKLQELYTLCNETEIFAVNYPAVSARSARNALEWVVKLFYLTKKGKYSETSTLFDLVNSADFTSYIDEPLLSAIHLIRMIGNSASHAEVVSKNESLKVLEALHNVVGEILKFLGIIDSYPVFDKSKIPSASPVTPEPVSLDSNGQPKKKYKVVIVKKDFEGYKKKIDTSSKMSSSIDFSEAETRKIFIDTALREAGWTVCQSKGLIKAGTASIEIPVKGMPSTSGDGFADYVLFDDDNKPLAVIEAKRTSKDVDAGSVQARLYADCLEKTYNVCPIIFYTNGYQIYMVDGGYPARRVFGYYSKEELHSLIVKRKLDKITDNRVDTNISDRPFIQMACTAVCDAYSAKRRSALNVMATGTGKTRFAISLVDILMRNDWIEHVLFLADRKELVSQAFKAFEKHLPDSSRCAVYSGSPTELDPNARIVVSTYPSILNLIDADERKFGVGHFDLIIVDECHRSVYNKYLAILRYFDSLVLGLTATPKDQVDADTYTLFGVDKNKPTYEYDYETAVREGFLVDYTVIDKTTKLLKRGLKYSDLSDSEKSEYEDEFTEDGVMPQEIPHDEFYRNIINLPTIDLVINTLMTQGLRTKGGEELGKTILFAVDHEHAVKIVERFKYLYPEKGDTYCQLIDYSVNYASAIIDDFKVPNKEPVIAVSVDMLDTGVDVPEVLNLVFFKRVRSPIKFWQMIGRGTRICKNFEVFSPDASTFGKHEQSEPAEPVECKDYDSKQGFFIVDFCDNFSFFSMNPKGVIPKHTLSITERIFNLKLDMVAALQGIEHQENPDHKKYYDKWRKELWTCVKGLNRHLVNVNWEIAYVDKYSNETEWYDLHKLKVAQIKSQITYLVESEADDIYAKTFDAWLFNMELTEIIGEKDYNKAVEKVTTVCYQLLEKAQIPQIAAKTESLKKIISTEFWQERSLDKLEFVRTEVRDLMKFLVEIKPPIKVTNFEDELVDKDKTGTHVTPSIKSYKQRVLDYLAENNDSAVIWKIKNIVPITEKDIDILQHILCEELGSEEEYEEIANGVPLPVFVRKIVGLDVEAVNKIFSEYLSKYNFNSAQEEFLHHIVTYVLQNGDIVPANIISNAPFNNLDYTEIFDDNSDAVFELIDVLHGAIAA